MEGPESNGARSPEKPDAGVPASVYGAVLPSAAWSTRSRDDITDREANHIAAIAELIRDFLTDRKGKAMLPLDQKCEILATVHEEFGRRDMAAERRREPLCRTALELSQLRYQYDHIYWPDQKHDAGEKPPPHTDSDAPPERHRGADRA